MSELKLLAIAMLLWGASNLAANTTSSDGLGQYRQQINQRVSKLNQTTPDLNLRERREPLNVPAALQTLSDVQKLDNALKGVEQVPDHSLSTLVCSRALCFKEGEE